MQTLFKSYQEFVKGNVINSFTGAAKDKVTTKGLTKAQAIEQFGKDAEYFTKSDIENFEKAVIQKCEENPEKYKELHEEGFKQLEGLKKAVVEGHIVYVRKKEE